MRKYHAANERVKRRYEQYLREAKGQDEKSIDKVRAALVKFEDCTKYKSFKAFHIDQARQFKDALSRAKNAHGKPLSLATTDATLRLVKGFFHWLAGQQGFKKVVTYADVEYFNNNRNDARAAHAQRPVHFPTPKAAQHAFQGMATQTEVQRRNKAIFALVMITGARGAAVASLRLKHINLVDGVCVSRWARGEHQRKEDDHHIFFPDASRLSDVFYRMGNLLTRRKALWGRGCAIS